MPQFILELMSIAGGLSAAVLWWMASRVKVTVTNEPGDNGWTEASYSIDGSDVAKTVQKSSELNACAALCACIAAGAQALKMAWGVVESLGGLPF